MGDFTVHLYADANDPMEVKLGCGRQGGLMGHFLELVID